MPAGSFGAVGEVDAGAGWAIIVVIIYWLLAERLSLHFCWLVVSSAVVLFFFPLFSVLSL